jgi:hypothetical protein
MKRKRGRACCLMVNFEFFWGSNFGIGDGNEEMTPDEYLALVRAGHIQPTHEELAQLGLLDSYDGEEFEEDGEYDEEGNQLSG